MKSYPSYKDSGLPWVGDIPSHWDTRKAKWVFKETSNKGYPNEILLSATQTDGVVPRDTLENRVVMPTGDLDNFKLVEVGDFVISLRSFQGGIEYSEYRGLVSPAYTVLKERTPIHKNYYRYLLKSFNFIDELNTAITGIRDGKNINYDDFGNLQILIPSIEEQKAIASFIESKLVDIDRYINKKKQLIDLLQEQKNTRINYVVTKGLNPSVKTKPSKIEWLEQIPEHWEELRAKYLFNEINERSETGGEELLSVSHITGVTPRSEKEVYMFMAESYEGYKTCKPGDLVINIMWSWMGALGVSQYSGIVSSAYGVYRQKKARFNGKYLEHLLRTKPYLAEFNTRSTGIRSSRLRMYTEDFFEVPIICPPLDEQQKISEYIDEEYKRTETAINAIEKEVALIQEYRTSLIAEAVTGKIDVRS